MRNFIISGAASLHEQLSCKSGLEDGGRGLEKAL